MLTVPKENGSEEKPGWAEMANLLEVGIFPAGVWDAIDEAIEVKIRAEDSKRRKAAGL
jgi:hypothetical protein